MQYKILPFFIGLLPARSHTRTKQRVLDSVLETENSKGCMRFELLGLSKQPLLFQTLMSAAKKLQAFPFVSC